MNVTFFKSKDCPQCPRAQQVLEEAVQELGTDISVRYVDISTPDGRIEALNNMVMNTPSVVIDEEVYGKDYLLDKPRLKEILTV
jgi:glutaredoxin